MKRIFSVIMVALTAAVTLFACAPQVADSGTVTVVVESKDGSQRVYVLELGDLENKKEGAVGVFEALRDSEDQLEYDLSSGPYGKYINSVGSLTPDTLKGEYIAVYTSCERDFDVSEWVKTIDFKGTELSTAGVGISQLTIEHGTVLLFRIENYR